jgi:hypothetical protein
MSHVKKRVRRWRTQITLMLMAGAGVSNCHCNERDVDGADADRSFETPGRQAALYKAKTFLVGDAPSAAEYAAYAADQAALPGLIDTWMSQPEFKPRMQEMFSFMFQQSAGSDEIGLLFREQNTDIFEQRQGRGGVDLAGPMRRSWALTAWDIIDQGRSFTEVATTRTFYMNVPLMMAMAYIDATPRDDTNTYVPGHSWLEDAFPTLTVSYTQQVNVSFNESVNPNSRNYGVFTISAPDGSAAGTSACEGLTSTFTGRSAVEEVYKYMMGAPFRTTCWSWNGTKVNVFTEPGDLTLRPVTLRVAEAGEARTVFWDLDALRTSSELVLGTEYVGFFGTPGFLAQWTTNDANEHRVTANQTLIVALGRTFDPGNNNVAIDDLAADDLHAAPGTECYGCHVTLDPLRDFFRQSYTYWGTARVDGMGQNEEIPEVAQFTIDGSAPVEGHGVGDLGSAIASSERFAAAWTEKMCGLVNAGLCEPSDPELSRIADVFSSSGYNFKTLLRELLSSSVVTYQEKTRTWEVHGAAVGAALQDDLCRRLERRTGIQDACALRGELAVLPGDRDRIAGYAGVVSQLGYARGVVAPDMPVAPTLFSTAGGERICEALAERFFGTKGGGMSAPLFEPSARDGAIEFFLSEVMGVWNDDPRAADLRDVLNAHWDAVIAAGESDDAAIQSTFAIACAAPQTTSVGL